MLDPQFYSDHDPHTVDPPLPHLHELQLLHKPRPTTHFNHASSPSMSLWKSPKLPPPEISHSSSTKKKKPTSVAELSCELALSISENPRRVCRLCFRHFSSGRALGGHMRVHGPLFQPAGTKRKLNYAESMDAEVRRGEDVVDSKYGDSLLSKNTSDKESGKFEDGAATSPSESDGEAVEDAHAIEVNVHQRLDAPKEFDGEDDNADGMSAYYGFNELVDNDHLDSSKKNDLYQLRHNPKRSRRFVDDDLTMETLLAGQGVNARGSVSSSLERPRVCSVCSKAFWSWKALFGHMRCHPEREWRGILPPGDSSVHEGLKINRKKPSGKTSFTAISSEYEHAESEVEDREDYTEAKRESHPHEKREAALKAIEEEEVTEEELAIMHSGIGETFDEDDSTEGDVGGGDWNPRWPTAGKRSRRKSTEGKAESLQQVNLPPSHEEPSLTSESTSLVESGEEEAHMEASNFLFMLAEAARKIERDTEVRKSLLQLCPDGPLLSPKEEGSGKHEGGAFLPLDDAKKPQLAPMSIASGMNVKYECSTCKKSFNSHQALGGHRASHRKMKGCFARTSLGDEMVFGERDEFTLDDVWYLQERQSSQVLEREKKPQQQLTKGHECSVCHRMFATGQALGGHKRCHYSGERAAEAANSVTSSNKHLSEEAHSSKLDEGGSILDLNMPAPNEEGEVACAPTELRLFHGKLDGERKGTLATKKSNGEGLSSASWSKEDTLGGQNRRPWELEGRWPMGSAVAY